MNIAKTKSENYILITSLYSVLIKCNTCFIHSLNNPIIT